MAQVISFGKLATLDRPGLPPLGRIQLSDTFTADYATMWRTQPHVRTVCGFLARNISQIGLHVYERISETDRRRLTGDDSPVSLLLGQPAPYMTAYRMMESLVQDMAIYDVSCWVKDSTGGRNSLFRLPPSKISPRGENWLEAEVIRYQGSKGFIDFPRDQVLLLRGYSPTDPRWGVSPMETLRQILAEEWNANQYRQQLWRNGARFPGSISRPVGAPQWSDTARQRFRDDWRGLYTGDGPGAGGTPILEDGMTFAANGITPEQAQYLESRKLTREEVAAAYHIPAPFVGILDHATFSNITEQHKNLYQDTLGPWLVQIEQEIDLQLVKPLDTSGDIYVEFNLESKMRGSFEEQASSLQTSVGAPWLTRGEARARMNLPYIDGVDELITPLNVTVGSGTDETMSSKDFLDKVNGVGALVRSGFDPHGSLEAGGLPPIEYLGLLPVTVQKPVDQATGDTDEDIVDEISKEHEPWSAKVKSGAEKPAIETRYAQALADHLDRLANHLTGSVKAPDDEWRRDWVKALEDALFSLHLSASVASAHQALSDAGIEPDQYDEAITVAYLQKWAAADASRYSDHAEAIAAGAVPTDSETQSDAIAKAIDGEKGFSVVTAATMATAVMAWAIFESGKQTGGATKTWVVKSSRPRASHAAMNGETVDIDSAFSNGLKWPGDAISTGDADEVAGCTCDLVVNYE